MAKVLIAGCGDLGCRLGLSLAQKGHEVHGIRRNIGKLPAVICPIKSDLAEQTPEVPDNIDYIYYILSASSFTDSAYLQAYVLGVKNLLQSIERQKIKRIFFISSTSVFGQSAGELVDESNEVNDRSFSSKRLLEGEELINQSHFPSTIIRFGGIYGKGRTHLIDLVLNGKTHCIEDSYSNRINSDDCIGVLEHLFKIDKHQQLDSLYIAVDDKPTLTCSIYKWLAKQLSVNDLEHVEPSEHSHDKRSNKRLSNKRLRDTGYKFKYPSYKEGYLVLLENMAGK